MATDDQRKAWQQALRAKTIGKPAVARGPKSQGIGPNKAAGRKGGIRRQGSKRG